MSELRTWNIAAAFLHLAAAVTFAFILPGTSVTLYKTAFDTTATPISDIDYPQELVPAGQSISIKILVVAFFAVTALFHIGYATDWFYTGKYLKAILGWGWNPFRWFEYSITASMMIYVISIIVGNKDTVTAITATLITPGLMFQGYTTERELMQNSLAAWGNGAELPAIDPYIVVLNFLPAWLFFFIKWYILFNAFNALQKDLREAGKPLDPMVSTMFYTQLVGFALFGIVQSRQVWEWWRAVHASARFPVWGYISYEKVYIALSFIVKLALGVSVALIL